MSDRPLGLWWLMAAGLVVGLVLIADDHLRRGGYVIAASLVAAALLRLVLPKSAAGSLAVRARGTDVVVLLALAAVLAVVLTVLDMRPRGPGSVNGLAVSTSTTASKSTSASTSAGGTPTAGAVPDRHTTGPRPAWSGPRSGGSAQA